MLPNQPQAIRRLVRDKAQTDARNISVVYSGPQNLGRALAADLADDDPTKNNHARAKHFAHATGANIIDRTTAGRMLVNHSSDVYVLLSEARKAETDARFPDRSDPAYNTALQRAIDHGRHQANCIFSLISREMCTTLSGAVRTFVCGAGADRVFRQDELESLMQNRDITSINGVERQRFEKVYHAERIAARRNAATDERTELTRTFRAICLAELRQDRAQAFRTGDPGLIQDVVLRHEIYRGQQAIENGAPPEPIEAVRVRIAERSAKIIAFTQNRNRSEARAGIEAIMAARVKQGVLTSEHAAALSAKLTEKLADPHRAYRINQSLKMQKAMERIRHQADPYAMGDYTRLYTALLTDTQLIKHRHVTTGNVPAPETTIQRAGTAFSDHVRTQQQRAYAHMGQEIAASRTRQNKAGAAANAKPRLLPTT